MRFSYFEFNAKKSLLILINEVKGKRYWQSIPFRGVFLFVAFFYNSVVVCVAEFEAIKIHRCNCKKQQGVFL